MTDLEKVKDLYNKAAGIACGYEARIALIQEACDIDSDVWLVKRDKEGTCFVYDGSSNWNNEMHRLLSNSIYFEREARKAVGDITNKYLKIEMSYEDKDDNTNK